MTPALLFPDMAELPGFASAIAVRTLAKEPAGDVAVEAEQPQVIREAQFDNYAPPAAAQRLALVEPAAAIDVVHVHKFGSRLAAARAAAPIVGNHNSPVAAALLPILSMNVVDIGQFPEPFSLPTLAAHLVRRELIVPAGYALAGRRALCGVFRLTLPASIAQFLRCDGNLAAAVADPCSLEFRNAHPVISHHLFGSPSSHPIIVLFGRKKLQRAEREHARCPLHPRFKTRRTERITPMSTTTNLADFGWRERRMAAALLTASCDQGFPEDFDDDEVVLMMNSDSGNVFLTNADCQVAMMNGDKLESFYTCPECGHEGFKEDMKHSGNKECKRYLRDIAA